MSNKTGKFVDLASLSMTGSLMPSIPHQLLLKFNPPKITMIYHFENNDKEKYYHDIYVERRMLESMTDDEIATHLFISEDYYFNPKYLKRAQVLRLVQKLKEGLKNPPKNKRGQQQMQNKQQQPHKNQPLQNLQLQQTNSQLSDGQSPPNETLEQRNSRKNFLQRRGFYNYEQQPEDQNESQDNKNQKQFEEDPIIQGRSSSKSPSHDMRKPVHQKLAPLSQGLNLPSLKSQQQQQQQNFNNSASLNQSQGNPNLNLSSNSQQPHFAHSPQQNRNNNNQSSTSQNNMMRNGGGQGVNENGYDDILNMVDFESDNDHQMDQNSRGNVNSQLSYQQQPEHQNYAYQQPQNQNQSLTNQGQLQNQGFNYMNQQMNDYADPYVNDQYLMGGHSNQQIDDFNLGNETSLTQNDQVEGDGEEEESVYIKDNIVMRRIQIEGEDQEYLMDPEGNIYDMQGNFIGTANTNELQDGDNEDDNIM
ncbi:UNKNOWN [Stylonychia lemnae]|uniref:Uncharacterized protein n=1 Tax=Stylonychia lemnae TaxID=5949 RepID=A0A077ZY06_STYLE|nr:UNKNOWN [Stylonychia lemnae]|eukprot:CDW74492.1 UNKNOWN [Stylonychia lemnae]